MNSEGDQQSLRRAQRVIEEAWVEAKRSPYVQTRLGIVPDRFPDLSFAEAERRSALGQRLIRSVDVIDPGGLPHEVALTLKLVRSKAAVWAREADWYWIGTDPCGIGCYGMFLPTAYCGGYLLNLVQNQLAAVPLQERLGAEMYRELLADYARLIEQFAARTAAQAERNIRMPKAQVSQARTLLMAFRSRARQVLGRHWPGLDAPPARCSQQIDEYIEEQIEPAFHRALSVFDADYVARAPDAVGMGRYPGSAPEVYAELVKAHTTLSLTPEEVHARGIERMGALDDSMRLIRAEAGFQGDSTAFIARINNDPRWHETTEEGVQGLFRRCLDRVNAHLPRLFAALPAAPCGVVPLPATLESSMTFGYYDPPKKGRSEGLYQFNAKNLMAKGLFQVPALTYHELMPGHHLQIALQQENERFHPFHSHMLVNSYNEGWAEYAAAVLAAEIGLYETPEERYGRLVFDAFLTSRLVVDTGMNALGWSIERAREYMRAHAGLSDEEIHSELLRYSSDIPAQALAYKLGDVELVAMRDRMRGALGEAFNLKVFHSAVLSAGAVPLPHLSWHIDYEIERIRGRMRRNPDLSQTEHGH